MATPTPTPPPPPPGAIHPVPWGLDTVAGVMGLWLLAFWSLGYVLVPGALEAAGVARDELTARGAALLHLALDAGELAATGAVLWRCLRSHRPRALGWFRSGRGRPARTWLVPLAAAAALFPFVDAASARAQAFFPPLPDAAAAAAGGGGGGPAWGANLLEAAIAGGDPITCGVYFAVVALCAPLWEEAVFRGFLLPSLARYLPAPAAVAASALAFAVAHFSPPRFVPLLLLGLLFGGVYARTRSLGAAVAAHSLWNCYIFAQLVVGRGGG